MCEKNACSACIAPMCHLFGMLMKFKQSIFSNFCKYTEFDRFCKKVQ